MTARKDRNCQGEVDVTYTLIDIRGVLAFVGHAGRTVELVVELLAVDISALAGGWVEQLLVPTQATVQIDHLISCVRETLVEAAHRASDNLPCMI